MKIKEKMKYLEKDKVSLAIVRFQAELSNLIKYPRNDRNVDDDTLKYAIGILNTLDRRILRMKPMEKEEEK